MHDPSIFPKYYDKKIYRIFYYRKEKFYNSQKYRLRIGFFPSFHKSSRFQELIYACILMQSAYILIRNFPGTVLVVNQERLLFDVFRLISRLSEKDATESMRLNLGHLMEDNTKENWEIYLWQSWAKGGARGWERNKKEIQDWRIMILIRKSITTIQILSEKRELSLWNYFCCCCCCWSGICG